MRNLAILAVFFLVVFMGSGVATQREGSWGTTVWGFNEVAAKAETAAETAAQKEPEINPDPMRSICAYMWDKYYEKEKAEIRVSTRGKYQETVVFTCPICSLEDHFVDPFLNTEYQGKTGMGRIKECGFTQVVFKGGRGLEEIVRQVP